MVDFDTIYIFLREYYLHSRFEGKNAEWPNGVPEGGTYSELVARGALEHLGKYGNGFISQYECRMGRAIHYDENFNILNPDEPPAQIQRKPGHLTHIYGG
jgi:hypothetical protein